MPHIKGYNKLREKTPAYEGKKFIFFPLLVLTFSFIGLIFLLLMDVLPRYYPENQLLVGLEPVLPVLGVIINAIIGWSVISLTWSRRYKYLEENKVTAYQKGIKYAFTGIGIIFSIILTVIIPS